MHAEDTPQRMSWIGNALHRELTAVFPALRTRQQNVLDVEKLADGIGMTEEGLYKWLRAGRILSNKGVEKIVSFANRPENLEALAKHGRQPPTKESLARFML
jgi:hypothetical protein